tara:strand:- start:114 stop:422 length:309 start_codon:yes stop_codon:yes gene_type:complete
MGFDLTGYEKDNISMTSFGVYTIAGIVALFVVIFFLAFYFFIVKESVYQEIVLSGGVEETSLFKDKQYSILNSYGEKGDDGLETSRIPINKAIENAVEYYND